MTCTTLLTVGLSLLSTVLHAAVWGVVFGSVLCGMLWLTLILWFERVLRKDVPFIVNP